METVRPLRRILALVVAAATVAIPTAAGAAPAPRATVLWHQHTSHGRGNVNSTTRAVTIPALVAGATTTDWTLHYQWHCDPGVYANPQITYTASGSSAQHGLLFPEWARRNTGSAYQWPFPSGTAIRLHWRMNIGRFGKAAGSGGTCSHTFKIVQSAR